MRNRQRDMDPYVVSRYLLESIFHLQLKQEYVFENTANIFRKVAPSQKYDALSSCSRQTVIGWYSNMRLLYHITPEATRFNAGILLGLFDPEEAVCG
jgi:hypothetical protein